MNEYRFYLTGKDASTWRRLVGRYYWLPDSQIISHLVEVHGLSCKAHCSLDSTPEADELGLPVSEFIYEDPDAEEETEPFTSLDGQVDQNRTNKTNSNAQSMDPQDLFCQGLNNTGPPPASLGNRWASTSAEEDQNGSFCQGAVITQNIHDSTQHKNQAAELSCEGLPSVTQGQESTPSRGAMETSLLLRCEQSPSVTQPAETDHFDAALQTLLLSAESELPPTQCNSSVLPLASTHGNLPNHSQNDQVNYTSCGPLNSTSQGVRVQRTMPSNYSETALSGNSKSVINCEAFNSTSITAYLHQDKNSPAFDKSVTKTVYSCVVEPALSENSNYVAFNDGENLQSPLTATENLQSSLTATDNLQSTSTATENLQSPLTATDNLQSPLTSTENLQSSLTATDNLQSSLTATDNHQSTSTATENLQSPLTATDNLQSPLTATENLQPSLTATENLQSPLTATDNLQCPLTAPFMPVIVSVESLSKVTEKESPEPDKSVPVPASSKQVLGKQPVVVLLKNKILHTLMEAQFIQTCEDKKAANQESVIKKLSTRTPTTSDKPQGEDQPCEGSLVNQDSIPPPVVDPSDLSDSGCRSSKAPSKTSSALKKTTIQKPSRKNLEFGTKYPSPSKDTEAEGRKRKGKGRGNSKKKRRPDRFCVYCRQIIKGGRIADHMRGKHKLEPEVQAILKKPFEAQMKFFTAKRREGNYLYNLLLMDKGKNQPLMRERTQSRSKEDEIKVCSDCKGFYSKRCFFKHKCVSDDISRDTRRLRKVFMDNMEKDIGFQNILGRFVHGEIDEFCKSNNSIKTMGYQYYNTHRMKKGMSEEARQTAITDMRELSRLFFHFRIICATGRAVEDMFDTDNMKDLMEAMKLLEALNGSSNYTETGEESALYNTVLRMVKSLDEFYTCTRQFETKKDLVNFKKSFTSKIKRFTVKKQTRIPELDAPPEPSGNASMEADNGMCELITEEPSTKQVTSEDTTKQGTFENTSSIISARKHITGDVNTEDTTTGMSVTEHITGEESSEQGTYVDASTNTSSRMPATEEGVRDVGTSDDSPKRKSGRTPVPKQFPDEVNGSTKRIRLENVHSEAEEETEKCPVEKIGRFSVKWSKEETHLLRRHFHSYIYTQNDKDDNTGNLPGKKEIQAFLKSHSIGCIKELKEKTQIQKIRTKIFNERKTSRERGWKKLREMEAAKRTVI
ncbi:uncharacterized protein LOC128171931 [Crassostrea angulata]|uniref:uncharacterized protein LOC128171931 n=1 Tax=Magallana angulata TaxID=2784310 RepID=UPI0022B15AB4|nr:uncharacterized protein LOC128171931 [Crassostrea angulata]